jgi:hypothetical protein
VRRLYDSKGAELVLSKKAWDALSEEERLPTPPPVEPLQPNSSEER